MSSHAACSPEHTWGLWPGGSDSNASKSSSAARTRWSFQGVQLTEANTSKRVYGNTVFQLTESGTREILSTGRTLSRRMRRCLFLIDGFRAVRELSYWMRADEINEVFEELEHAGYILRVVEGDESYATHAPMSLPSVEKLESIKRNAVAYLRDRLGGAADFVISEIERCTSDMELRATLRAVEDILVAAFGKTHAVSFLKSVGGETMEI
jgi:hypothetical protein